MLRVKIENKPNDIKDTDFAKRVNMVQGALGCKQEGANCVRVNYYDFFEEYKKLKKDDEFRLNQKLSKENLIDKWKSFDNVGNAAKTLAKSLFVKKDKDKDKEKGKDKKKDYNLKITDISEFKGKTLEKIQHIAKLTQVYTDSGQDLLQLIENCMSIVTKSFEEQQKLLNDFLSVTDQLKIDEELAEQLKSRLKALEKGK